jgi:hypothetical protein
MSDNALHPDPGPSRKFIPEINPLESRLLLSRIVSFPDGTRVVFPSVLHLPRTGGVSFQNGTLLGIGVGQPTTNTVHVTDDGKGDVQAKWNGGPVHSLTGTTETVIQARRARRDHITFNLTGARTVGTAIAVGSFVLAGADSTSEQGRPQSSHSRTSGTAGQSGSLLTVTVDKPTSNTVAISNDGAGAVQVEWNGGKVHSFTGVETIVVDTEHARNDLVALDDVTH